MTVRPAGVAQRDIDANLGELVESLLVAPIILSMFSVRHFSVYVIASSKTFCEIDPNWSPTTACSTVRQL